MMLFPDGLKAKIKLFHHGEIMVGIEERLGSAEMNSILTLTQEVHADKENRDKEKEQQEAEKDAGKKKGKRAEQEKKSTFFAIIFGGGIYMQG